MYAKKIISISIFIIFLNASLFGDDFDIESLNGVYFDNIVYELILKDERKSRELMTFEMLDEGYKIQWNNKIRKGIFQTGTQINEIKSIEINKKMATIYYYRSDMKYAYERKIILEYVSRDLIKVIESDYHRQPKYLYRIYDFSKKTKALGIINNARVRLRTKPELTGYVWFFLDYRERIEILGISEEKQQIGELEAYWYEIRVNNKEYLDAFGSDRYLDGWVFGAYVDVDNREVLEEKLLKKRL
jgi:hypothetical protein